MRPVGILNTKSVQITRTMPSFSCDVEDANKTFSRIGEPSYVLTHGSLRAVEKFW